MSFQCQCCLWIAHGMYKRLHYCLRQALELLRNFRSHVYISSLLAFCHQAYPFPPSPWLGSTSVKWYRKEERKNKLMFIDLSDRFFLLPGLYLRPAQIPTWSAVLQLDYDPQLAVVHFNCFCTWTELIAPTTWILPRIAQSRAKHIFLNGTSRIEWGSPTNVFTTLTAHYHWSRA